MAKLTVEKKRDRAIRKMEWDVFFRSQSLGKSAIQNLRAAGSDRELLEGIGQVVSALANDMAGIMVALDIKRKEQNAWPDMRDRIHWLAVVEYEREEKEKAERKQAREAKKLITN